MKLYMNSDHLWRPIVVILAILVTLQLIFSRQVYDVTIYAYRVMQAYYVQDWPGREMFWNNGSNFSEHWILDKNRLSLVSNGGASNLIMGEKFGSSRQGNLDISDGNGNSNGTRSGNESCVPELGTTFTYNETTDQSVLNTINGGSWSPTTCRPVTSTALIIPFRERHSHLKEFIPYMHAFLQKQQLHYRIFVIEQHDNSSFNRAKLMNIGYMETEKNFTYDCYVFHDVDLLPLDERIGYNCSEKGPMHLAAAMDKFGFAMPYSGFFGGACAFTRSQLEKINGFSNQYVGWGGEDDDIDYRIRYSGQHAHRYPVHIARYHMIKHGPDKGNEANPQRHKLLEQTRRNWKIDGLNSLVYDVVNVEENLLYTKIAVNVV